MIRGLPLIAAQAGLSSDIHPPRTSSTESIQGQLAQDSEW